MEMNYDSTTGKYPMKKVGYAFVPVQNLEKVYSPCKALKAGTIFPELDITMEEYERGLYDGK